MTGESRRIDQWLFFTRLVKSRSLAQKLVGAGAIRINREKVTKPGQAVSPGDVVTAVIHERVRTVRVLGCGGRRGPAPEAQALYEDLAVDAGVDGEKRGCMRP